MVARQRTSPQGSLLEKVSAIAQLGHVLVVHHFAWVLVSRSAMRFT